MAGNSAGRVAVAIVVGILGLPGSLGAVEKETTLPGRTSISGVPWRGAGTLGENKVIYGADDRRDAFAETDAARQALADSTCALVGARDLVEQEDGSFQLRVSDYRIFGLPACEGEPFGDQPAAAFCTGFMVGPDLIATAGHCITAGELVGARFVFGFRMRDATTPKLTFDAAEVYTGIEVVARQLEGDFDYAIIRVDRDVAAPGARILPIRTAGEIAPGTPVGVVGHPSGLPVKIAFGEDTVVRENGNSGFFVANLDTYGGNSGSPVFNAETLVVEGILVRGEADFESSGNCFRSRVLTNGGGTGEDVSTATSFSTFVQTGRGTVSLDRSAYQCEDTLAITLFDHDLAGLETASVRVFTSGADTESVDLVAEGVHGTFAGTLLLATGTPSENNGRIEAMAGDSLFVAYSDADTGNGAPGDAVATARVDCTPPEISDVRVTDVGGNYFTVAFTTSEPASGAVTAGLACDSLDRTGEGAVTTGHRVDVRNLDNETTYAFEVRATDPAGNTGANNQDGACYRVTTTDTPDFLTEFISPETADLSNRSVIFTPDDSPAGYTACTVEADGFPTSPFCGEAVSLSDDDAIRYRLTQNREVPFFGQSYSAVYVGSNGYLTFGESDVTYTPTLENHFALPRISGYYADLFPPETGQVIVAEREDRLAVTYYNVIDIVGNLQSFQIELFYDGPIRLTWVVQTMPEGIVGLSRGMGIDEAFVPSDLSAYTPCDAFPYGDIMCDTGVENDHCAEAITADLEQTYSGSTVFALGSSDITGCESCFGADVWYTFTPTTSGTYTLSLCNSDFDTVLGLYQGTCDGLTAIASNDDGVCGFQSEIVADLAAGTTYRIRISGFRQDVGSYQFVVLPGGKGSAGCHGGARSAGYGSDAVIAALLLALLAWQRRRRRVEG